MIYYILYTIQLLFCWWIRFFLIWYSELVQLDVGRLSDVDSFKIVHLMDIYNSIFKTLNLILGWAKVDVRFGWDFGIWRESNFLMISVESVVTECCDVTVIIEYHVWYDKNKKSFFFWKNWAILIREIVPLLYLWVSPKV